VNGGRPPERVHSADVIDLAADLAACGRQFPITAGQSVANTAPDAEIAQTGWCAHASASVHGMQYLPCSCSAVAAWSPTAIRSGSPLRPGPNAAHHGARRVP